ncbi:hypothetical protein [Bacillus sp. AFS040349]|uniref:hypothetical protein n=1 Tax=Bacillus sp. AFS040349 TaxID=2033502 RepID=UPI000BFB84AF|nr:hypothetical protein [Bacillus sp. AFS040349]PGT89224.1 hypothetical protein COD11_04290 [Bacillus sp. AFS040349]
MPTNTPRLGIPKPLGNEYFNRTKFNEILDTIDTGAAKDSDLTAHKADETQGAHKAKNIAVEDLNAVFTATDVEGALNELKTDLDNIDLTASSVTTDQGTTVQTELDTLKSSVNNGKTTVKNAIIGKGGTVLDGDGDGVSTFAELEAGISGLGTLPIHVTKTILSTNTPHVVKTITSNVSPWGCKYLGNGYGFVCLNNGSTGSYSMMIVNKNGDIVKTLTIYLDGDMTQSSPMGHPCIAPDGGYFLTHGGSIYKLSSDFSSFTKVINKGTYGTYSNYWGIVMFINPRGQLILINAAGCIYAFNPSTYILIETLKATMDASAISSYASGQKWETKDYIGFKNGDTGGELYKYKKNHAAGENPFVARGSVTYSVGVCNDEEYIYLGAADNGHMRVARISDLVVIKSLATTSSQAYGIYYDSLLKVPVLVGYQCIFRYDPINDVMGAYKSETSFTDTFAIYAYLNPESYQVVSRTKALFYGIDKL